MGKGSGREVELAAVEQDADPVVVKLAEAAGCGLDGLNSAVEAFALSLGDFVATVRQQVLQMALDHLGNLDHRR